ncbi:hypothetical protein [Citrobacter braakii]|uniref:hypothetical protein n=1 Tax=Citrobacter braakii TaxID=57706 RepID=UPI001BCFB5E6|nr:hypothetical protein [Citrobacter braakii]EIV7044122.1 hypothetical protein [Escherichia coli]EKR5513085.1 hypothetical protein [Escherichia coli]ELZ3075937.1 hypothetical protein [Escherichia coli]MEB2437281.1 hypothetical protein [Citrobacter braakii]
MEKYLYLTKCEWVSPWVNGGEIPLSCASSYKRVERGGVFTPDENLIDNSTHDINQFGSAFCIENSTVNFYGGFINGKSLPEFMRFDRRTEDGLVLCLANRRSNYIAKKLGKNACVKILDVIALKNSLDEQIGIESEMGPCRYTVSHSRGHFLKSALDSWQDEFRLFWPNTQARYVFIPPNIAIQIPIRGSQGY